MDESANMLRRTEAKTLRAADVDSDARQARYLQVANYLGTDDTALPKIPKRKLSVFYRSFNVITPMNREKEKETVEFRRASSTPSVRIEKMQDAAERKNDGARPETSSSKKSFVNEHYKPFNDAEISTSKAVPASPTAIKLPRVGEDTIADNYATKTGSSIGKHLKLNDRGEEKPKGADEKNVAIHFLEKHAASGSSKFYFPANAKSIIVENTENKKTDGPGNVIADLPSRELQRTRPTIPHATACIDLVKIRYSEYPRTFPSASSAGPLGKYTSVGRGMSNQEDSSIGSDSEDDPMDRTMEKSPPRANAPSRRPSSPSITEPPGKPDLRDGQKRENVTEHPAKQRKRQKFFVARRSLSEGDGERHHRTKCHCKCVKEDESGDEEEQLPAFPSFADNRLRASGLSEADDKDALYRVNLPETELERKYIAFSIGLCTDRITLQRRMALSVRHRDLAERNLLSEIQRMEVHIQELSPLCMDGESIQKVERVRHQLDMIAQCARKVSSAAETLGAVCQERRISKAISIADKYLQILRARCDHLATEIAETKQILLRNNIVIEENSGEIGDDLLKIRYRNGFPSNNRTVIARRRASIATISRPLTSQDIIKEGPRQRNSVSGRVTIRRPSFCSETQKWETEKLNRTDSSNSVCELCDIFEQTESTRRNSVKESNSSSLEQTKDNDTVKHESTTNVEDNDRLADKRTSFLDSGRSSEQQLNLCKITTEPLRIPRDLVTWPTVLWCTLIFFLGFFTKHITSSANV